MSAVDLLRESQYDLSEDGMAFLLDEARQAAFFLLGEVHFSNEIPELLRELWPDLWASGYRHVAAEMSPWMARRVEFPAEGESVPPFFGLWTVAEVELVTGLKEDGAAPVLWGTDLEVLSPHLVVRALAAEHANNPHLQTMVEATAGGYRRSLAPALAELLAEAAGVQPQLAGKLHSFVNLAHTFAVEADRLDGNRLRASARREEAMKELFLSHYRAHAADTGARVLARLGRNHLHRGIDRRGVSTLGNFIAEVAAARGLSSFHVAAFAAGGRIRAGLATVDADETSGDSVFELLASLARHQATVFDLRPARPALHAIPLSKRSAAERSLVYWSDSYDAIICFREVTPLRIGAR
ncbi:MAG: hypothetical protein OXG74_06580 [Acidobacteria bacterium]|nr:hypothetical protein [Acidobacteriota bacterium]